MCLSLDGENLNYVSTEDIAGFQFNHTGCVDSASGGDAQAAGFVVSTSSSTVLGFSFSGATFGLSGFVDVDPMSMIGWMGFNLTAIVMGALTLKSKS